MTILLMKLKYAYNGNTENIHYLTNLIGFQTADF